MNNSQPLDVLCFPLQYSFLIFLPQVWVFSQPDVTKHSIYSMLLNCNRAVTIRTVLDIPLMLVHLDRVCTQVSIAVIIWTVFLQKYPSWLYFLALLGPCFFTSFHCGFTNKTVFLHHCPLWLLIGPCFFKKFMGGS